jgi:hypothetical protein
MQLLDDFTSSITRVMIVYSFLKLVLCDSSMVNRCSLNLYLLFENFLLDSQKIYYLSLAEVSLHSQTIHSHNHQPLFTTHCCSTFALIKSCFFVYHQLVILILLQIYLLISVMVGCLLQKED